MYNFKESEKIYQQEIKGLNEELEIRKRKTIRQDKEIERLNNILNELGNYLNEDDWSSVNGEVAIKLIKNKIKELKGEDKE